MAIRADRAGALRSIAYYTVLVGLVGGANFLTTPLLIALLGEAEFARWVLLEPILLMGIPIAGFGIHLGLVGRITGQPVADRHAVATLLPFYVLSSIAVGLVAAGIVSWGGEAIVAGALIGGVVVSEGVMAFAGNLWRAQDRAGLVTAFEGGRAAIVVLLLAASILGLFLVVSDTESYLTLRLIALLVAIFLTYLLVRPGWRPDIAETRRAIGYGGPIVLASLCSAALLSIDRYALAPVATDAALASYVAHVKLAQVAATAVSPFFTWLGPKAIQHLAGDRRDHAFFVSSTSAFVVIVVAAFANLWVVAPALWPLLFRTIPFDGELFAVLLVGMAIYSLGNPVSVGVLRPGKTYQALVITIISMIVAAGACFALAAPLGVIGAGAGRGIGLLAYTTLFGLATVLALRVRYQWGAYALISLGAAAACVGLEALFPGGNWIAIAIKLLCLNVPLVLLFVWVMRKWPGRVASEPTSSLR
jgi:O-antigen/teichoic acid export membrane protein